MSDPGIGHNSGIKDAKEGVVGDNGIVTGAAGKALQAYIERIERLEEEKKGIGEDIKEIYGEAKGTGFNVKVIRQIIALRKEDPADRKERLAIMDLYLEALGMY
jgi:uncharacterized protein (UPF0335 family)